MLTVLGGEGRRRAAKGGKGIHSARKWSRCESLVRYSNAWRLINAINSSSLCTRQRSASQSMSLRSEIPAPKSGAVRCCKYRRGSLSTALRRRLSAAALSAAAAPAAAYLPPPRSEERRVGKECRSRCATEPVKKESENYACGHSIRTRCHY